MWLTNRWKVSLKVKAILRKGKNRAGRKLEDQLGLKAKKKLLEVQLNKVFKN